MLFGRSHVIAPIHPAIWTDGQLFIKTHGVSI
jgi:hypothetical protein